MIATSAIKESRVLDSAHEPVTHRNLIVCCDGTGNIWLPGSAKTNVAKLFEVLEKTDEQIAYYDPGVGTPDGSLSGDENGGLAIKDIARRVGGLTWGDGIWQNVAQAYEFLMDNYRAGDRIYLFGFSRGAFTVRAVSGMVHMFGLLQHHHKNLIPSLLRVYRSPEKGAARGRESGRQKTAREFKQQFALTFPGAPIDDPARVPIHFIGVWDTVESVGVAEFLGGKISSEPTVKPEFIHVRHALALDEIRWPFKPREYIEPHLPDDGVRTFKQVWFRGAHSDVGGSYSDDQGLSNTAWHWMVREAFDKGLLLKNNALTQHPTNPFGVLHSEITSSPPWILAGAFQREIPKGITIHNSVELRSTKEAMPPEVASKSIAISHTLDKFIVEGKEVEIPVPSKSGNPRRQVLRSWVYVVLILSGFFGLIVYDKLLGEDGRYVAIHLQFSAFLHSLNGGYGKALSDFGNEIVMSQMLSDFLFIICYSIFATSLLSVLLYWSSFARYPGSIIGKMIGYSLIPLVAFDLLENWLTVLALRNYAQSADEQALWIPPVFADYTFAFLTTLSSLGKFFSLAGVLLVTVVLLFGTIRALIKAK